MNILLSSFLIHGLYIGLYIFPSRIYAMRDLYKYFNFCKSAGLLHKNSLEHSVTRFVDFTFSICVLNISVPCFREYYL